MQSRRHKHFKSHRPSWKHRRTLTNWLKKLPEKKVQTLLYTLADKKTVALTYTLVARLREVQVKTIGDTVTTMETKALVETLSEFLIKMKSRRQSTQ